MNDNDEDAKKEVRRVIEKNAQVVARMAIKYGIPKCHLTEIISTEYDLERDNRRSPQ